MAGDRVALARAISLVEDRDPAAGELIAAAFPHTGGAQTIGLTGPPGAGKSSLAAAICERLRAGGETVAVLSVDPTSPFTGGAVLGDRIRLERHFLDEGVFIRSMASRGASGGLAEAAFQAVLLLDAAGFDRILIETVGVGQSEVDVAGRADTVVLALMPGSGDSVQALKAGVMEIPDVVAVNKSDHPDAHLTARDSRAALRLVPGEELEWVVPVILTQALNGDGVGELLDQVAAHREHLTASGGLADRRRSALQAEVIALAVSESRRRIEAELGGDPAAAKLISEVGERQLDPVAAAKMLLENGRDDRNR